MSPATHSKAPFTFFSCAVQATTPAGGTSARSGGQRGYGTALRSCWRRGGQTMGTLAAALYTRQVRSDSCALHAFVCHEACTSSRNAWGLPAKLVAGKHGLLFFLESAVSDTSAPGTQGLLLQYCVARTPGVARTPVRHCH